MSRRKPPHLLSMRSLRRYECGLCGQRLDRMKRSQKACSAIWSHDECDWHARLNPTAHTEATKGDETDG